MESMESMENHGRQQICQGKGLFHMCHIQILQVAQAARADANWKGGQVEAFVALVCKYGAKIWNKISRKICIHSECKKQKAAKLCNKQLIQ